MHFKRTWAEEVGSEDSFGRAVWSVGVTARDASSAKQRDWASTLFDRIAGEARGLEAPRARAFAMLGAAAIQDAHPGHGQSKRILEEFGETLLSLLHISRRTAWARFEAALSYETATTGRAP